MNRTDIIISLITISIIRHSWLWIVRTFFHTEHQWALNNSHIVLRSFAVVGLLLFYGYIAGRGINVSEQSRESVTLFVVYCSLIAFFVYSIKQSGNNYHKQLLIASMCLFFVLVYGSFFFVAHSIIGYVLISVYAEEYLKIHTSGALTKHRSIKQYIGRDLIFFALLMGLGFSFAEHIAYLIHYVVSGKELLRGVHIARGLLTTSIHIVASGIIAYSTLQWSISKKYRQGGIVGFVLAVGLHGLYNLSIHFGWTLLIVVLGILSYYILSYLLYQTNIVYDDTKTHQS